MSAEHLDILSLGLFQNLLTPLVHAMNCAAEKSVREQAIANLISGAIVIAASEKDAEPAAVHEYLLRVFNDCFQAALEVTSAIELAKRQTSSGRVSCDG